MRGVWEYCRVDVENSLLWLRRGIFDLAVELVLEYFTEFFHFVLSLGAFQQFF